MVDFVEQATLRVRDQSTGPINKINKAIANLLKQAKQLNNIKVGIDTGKANRDVQNLSKTLKNVPKNINSKVSVKVAGMGAVQKQLANLSKTQVAGVRIRLTNLQSIRQQLQTQLNLNGPRGPRGGNPNAAAGRGFAQSFLNALRPENAGASIARGFLSAVGGNIQRIVSDTLKVAGSAPLNKEDAVQRLRTAGLDDSTVNFMQQEASRLSGIYKGTTETSILESGREAAGRFDTTTPEGLAQLTVVMERLAKNTQILSAVTGKGIVNGGDQARLIEGAISQVGATSDPKEAEATSTAIIRGIIASGGDLTAYDAKRTLQQLGGARGNLSEDTLTQLLLLRDEGGARSTGEFRQLFQDLVRGNLNKNDKAAQVESGLRGPGAKPTNLAGRLQENFLDTVEDFFIPLLKKRGVDVNNKIEVATALDDIGLSAQGGIATLTDAIINIQQSQAEFRRAERANLSVPVNDPTVRQRGEAVNAQFQNLADNALGGVLPVVSAGLATVANSLAAFNKGEAGITDYAALGAGAVSAGIGASIMSIANASPAERPLALAGLSLNTSAAALSGAAAALTTAAGVQAGASTLGGLANGGGLLGWFKNALILAGVATGTKVVSEAVQVPLDGMANAIAPGSVERAKANEADVAKRGWDQMKAFVAAATASLTENKPSAEVASRIIANTKDDSGFIKVGPVNPAAASPDFAALITTMTATPTELTTAFDTGNAGLSQASATLAAVSQQFGPLVAAALLATGGPLGAQIGAAISAAISGASVNVNATVSGVEPSLDTGSQLPKN